MFVNRYSSSRVVGKPSAAKRAMAARRRDSSHAGPAGRRSDCSLELREIPLRPGPMLLSDHASSCRRRPPASRSPFPRARAPAPCRPTCTMPAVAQHVDEVGHDVVEQPLVVRDHDDRALGVPHRVDALGDGLQRVDVEARVGLVEDRRASAAARASGRSRCASSRRPRSPRSPGRRISSLSMCSSFSRSSHELAGTPSRRAPARRGASDCALSAAFRK